jgi:hypothetical protein
MKFELEFLLLPGTYKVEYLSNKELSNEQKEILHKLFKLSSTNEYAKQFLENTTVIDLPEFDHHIGISKAEYDRLKPFFILQGPLPQTGTVTLEQFGNTVRFKGTGQLALLDSLTVDVKTYSATYKEFSLVQNLDGYNVIKEFLPKGDSLEVKHFFRGPERLTGMLFGQYILLIGKLKPSGKTYLSFYAKLPPTIEKWVPEYCLFAIDVNTNAANTALP